MGLGSLAVVVAIASRSPAVAALFRCGEIVGYDEAVRLGRASARDKPVRPAASNPPCQDWPCVAGAVGDAAREAVAAPVRAVHRAVSELPSIVRAPSVARLDEVVRGVLPLQPVVLVRPAIFPFLLVVAGGAIAALVRAIRLGGRTAPPGSSPAGRLLMASLAAIAVAGLGLSFSAELASALSDQGHEATILVSYLRGAGRGVSIGLLWPAFLAAWMVLASRFVVGGLGGGAISRLGRRGAASLLAAGLALWIALPLA
jgi:hypothetical protein